MPNLSAVVAFARLQHLEYRVNALSVSSQRENTP